MMCDAQVDLFTNFFFVVILFCQKFQIKASVCNKMCFNAAVIVAVFFVAFLHLKSFRKIKPERAIFALSKHV